MLPFRDYHSHFFAQVSMMEVDLLAGNHMAESLVKTQVQVEALEKEIHIATLMASSTCHIAHLPSRAFYLPCIFLSVPFSMHFYLQGSVAPESASMKLISAVEQLKDMCSRTVSTFASPHLPTHSTSRLPVPSAAFHSNCLPFILYIHMPV